MRLLIALITTLLPLSLSARDLSGTVIAVHDGDTLTMQMGNYHRIIIRLAEIDAPEVKQPYGDESRQALIDLVQGQRIVMHKVATDKYHRTVGTVYRSEDGLNVNQELVWDGDAWAYRAYLLTHTMLVLEDAARASETGLWALPEEARLPPWRWRQEHRKNGLKIDYKKYRQNAWF